MVIRKTLNENYKANAEEEEDLHQIITSSLALPTYGCTAFMKSLCNPTLCFTKEYDQKLTILKVTVSILVYIPL
jgi:hypothetical protein